MDADTHLSKGRHSWASFKCSWSRSCQVKVHSRPPGALQKVMAPGLKLDVEQVSTAVLGHRTCSKGCQVLHCQAVLEHR